jgi:hypothetical protein
MLRRTASLSLLFPLLLGACTHVAVDATDTATGTVTSSCAALYDAYADWSRTCTGVAPDEGVLSDLAARCVAHAALPGLQVSAAAVHECVAAVAGADCAGLPLACLTNNDIGYAIQPNDIWVGPSSYTAAELFPRVPGTLPAGAACDLSLQCESGDCSSYQSCGVCLEDRGVGQACDDTTRCVYGTGCTGGVCVEWGSELGEPCQAPKGSSNCKISLYCPVDTCVPRLAVGAACSDSVLLAQACVEGSKCVEGECRTVVTVPDGADCNDAALCAEGTFCMDGSCRAPRAGLGEGQDCGIDRCALGLACSYGVCTTAVAAGVACSIDVPCDAGLYCDPPDTLSGTCRALGAEGEACVHDDNCAPGLSCYGVPDRQCHHGERGGADCTMAACGAQFTCLDGICADLDACSTAP